MSSEKDIERRVSPLRPVVRMARGDLVRSLRDRHRQRRVASTQNTHRRRSARCASPYDSTTGSGHGHGCLRLVSLVGIRTDGLGSAISALEHRTKTTTTTTTKPSSTALDTVGPQRPLQVRLGPGPEPSIRCGCMAATHVRTHTCPCPCVWRRTGTRNRLAGY